MKLAFSPLAKLDLKEIWNYVFVESNSEVLAARLIDKLSRTSSASGTISGGEITKWLTQACCATPMLIIVAAI